ncbi:hypothetical protein [Yersinia ruckeri]|uniref:hypothetical protein n=1 Tax=Yersinia ruckeri TaxID=29486 RepID=UPI002237F9D1|nr:hypothetical protein [Yersinia ruckeri]MCW6598658.1 hypothetical protein [Yersinia ruckeri]
MPLPLKTNVLSDISNLTSGIKNSISGGSSSASKAQDSIASANLPKSKIDIPRNGWIMYPALNPSDKIVFNVNPASIDYTFAGRRSNSKTRYGRVFTQGYSNDLVNNMDIDVAFQMQSGNLLNPDSPGSPTEGSATFFKILQFATSPIFKDGKLNYFKLEINTVMMGTITLLGFLEPNISLSESADNPFLVNYPLTFNVFSTEPSVADFSQIKSAIKTAATDTASDTETAANGTNGATGTTTGTSAGGTSASKNDIVSKANSPSDTKQTSSPPSSLASQEAQKAAFSVKAHAALAQANDFVTKLDKSGIPHNSELYTKALNAVDRSQALVDKANGG